MPCEAGETEWPLGGTAKDGREQDTVWTVSGEKEPPSHTSTTPNTHSLVILGDKGQALDSHVGYRMEARITNLDIKGTVT